MQTNQTISICLSWDTGIQFSHRQSQDKFVYLAAWLFVQCCQDDFSFGIFEARRLEQPEHAGELPKRSGPPVDQHIMQLTKSCLHIAFFAKSGAADLGI